MKEEEKRRCSNWLATSAMPSKVVVAGSGAMATWWPAQFGPRILYCLTWDVDSAPGRLRHRELVILSLSSNVAIAQPFRLRHEGAFDWRCAITFGFLNTAAGVGCGGLDRRRQWPWQSTREDVDVIRIALDGLGTSRLTSCPPDLWPKNACQCCE